MVPATTRPRIGKTALRTICLFIVGVMLAFGLWPFNPFPRNRVLWLENQNGIRFGNRGVVFSSGNFEWPSSPDAVPCTLEIWLQPGPHPGDQGTILTFYQPRAPERFKLFQWQHSTLLLYKDDDRSRHQEIDVEDTFHPDVPLLITVTSGPAAASVYINGVLARTSGNFALSRIDLSGQIILGTSALADDRWAGQLRGLAMYGRELTAAEVSRHLDAWRTGVNPDTARGEGAVALYTFSERTGNMIHDRLGTGPDLYIPESYSIAHKPLLLPPWRDFLWNWDELQDVSINIAGFIPLAFFACAFLSANPPSKRAVLNAILFGAAFSIAIEVLQVYLPTRTSSMTDVINDTLGTCIGVLLYRSRIAQFFFNLR